MAIMNSLYYPLVSLMPPPVFIVLMNRVFRPYLDNFIIVSIDDILIYSKSEKEHDKHLRIVLETLKEHELYTKPKRCEVWLNKFNFLGHVISNEGISFDTMTIEAIVDCPRPTNVTEVQSFLGMVGYYRSSLEVSPKLLC